MIKLKDYLFSKLERVDCHVNQYGKNSYHEYSAFAFSSIHFVDNDIKNLDEPLMPYYKEMEKDFMPFTQHYVACV